MPQQHAEGSAEMIVFRPRGHIAGFTGRDLIELHAWAGDGRRLEIDAATDEIGQFAMVYDGAQPWASYAISREGAAVLVWDCISLADIGRFPTMSAALAGVPRDGAGSSMPTLPCAQVISFQAAAARRSAA